MAIPTHIARRIHGAEHPQGGIRKRRAFHINAHKIVVPRRTFRQAPQIPPRQPLINRQAQLSELHRNVRIQLLHRQPVKKLKIGLAGSFGGRGFVDALHPGNQASP